MSVPKFNEIMLPLLKLCADKKIYTVAQATSILEEQMNLSEEDKSETIKSGDSRFKNNVGWARTYLKKATLLESQKRGYFNITDEGLKVLDEDISELTFEYLCKYPSFAEFWGVDMEENSEVELSPIDRLERSYNEINSTLASDLLEAIINNPPDFFERLVVDLLLAMGYGGSRQDAGKVVGRVGDNGIDGIIDEDKLGLDKIYIQAKRFSKGNKVSSTTIDSFSGALDVKGARKGIFITTSEFTPAAIKHVEEMKSNKRIVLIDGEKLTNLMIEYDVGVSTKDTYKIKTLDNDYFDTN